MGRDGRIKVFFGEQLLENSTKLDEDITVNLN